MCLSLLASTCKVIFLTLIISPGRRQNNDEVEGNRSEETIDTVCAPHPPLSVTIEWLTSSTIEGLPRALALVLLRCKCQALAPKHDLQFDVPYQVRLGTAHSSCRPFRPTRRLHRKNAISSRLRNFCFCQKSIWPSSPPLSRSLKRKVWHIFLKRENNET